MTVTENIVDAGPALGSFEIRLAEETPDEVLAQLGYYGHVVVLDSRVDVVGAGDALLDAARYVGVLREKPHEDGYALKGDGLSFWLGDEDDKARTVYETQVSLTNATLTASVTALLPATVTLGTVHTLADPSKRYTGKHRYESPRKALTKVCEAFGVEYRVNGDFSVDFGRPDQLYNATPTTAVVRRGAGADIDVVALPGDVDTDESARDYSTDVLLLGQTTDDKTFATGSASVPSVPYLDPQGNQLKLIRMISESGETTGTVAQRAQLQINRFGRLTRSIKVTADEYEVPSGARVGDYTWVWDPDSGIFDAANELDFRGQLLHPAKVRVTGATWPVTQGMTVAFRTHAGVWLDLTDYVTWDTPGSQDLTVGDLPKSLTRGDTTIPDRVDGSNGAKNDVPPKAPTGLTLSTSSFVDSKGVDRAIISASWTAPTQNTDNTVLTDLAYFVVQWKWTSRAQWQETATASTDVDLPAALGLVYDVRVQAVDSTGAKSAFTSIASILTAADTTAPPTPSDPVLEPYFGLLRVKWDGLDSTGQPMPADFDHIEVHISATNGFTPSASTRMAESSVSGIAGHVDAPYGATRYVKLVALDHTGNASPPSGQVSGATVKVNDGDIQSLNVGKLTAGVVTADITVAGRFATSLISPRTELNSIGVQAWNAAGTLTVNIDGLSNLLTGEIRTGLSGRRIIIGASGSIGRITFFAPDGTTGVLESYTDPENGNESIRQVMPITGAWPGWNGVQFQTNERAYLSSGYVAITFGGSGAGQKQFVVAQGTNDGSASAQPTRVPRLEIDTARSTLYAPDNNTNIEITDDNIRHFVGTTASNGSIDISPHGVADSRLRSPRLLFRAEGGTRGSYLKYVIDGDDGNPRIEVTNTSDTGYGAIWASAFTVSSAPEGKVDIADVDQQTMLDKLRAMRVRSWRQPLDGGRLSEPRYGLVTTEAPADIVEGQQEAINLYSTVAFAIGGLQRVFVILAAARDRIVGLEGKVATLEGRVA